MDITNRIDPYTFTKDRIVYTNQQHHVPSVETLGYCIAKNAGPAYEWHIHEDAFEFTIVTKGRFSFSTLNTTYKFSPGEVFISYPNEIHGTDVPITLSEIYWFQLKINDPDNFLFMKSDAAIEMITKLKAIPHHVVNVNTEKVYPLLKQAFYLAQQGADPVFIAAYLQLFLHHVITASNDKYCPLTPDIGKTLNYILNNITLEISLEELAAIANLSCSQYKHKFKRQLGTSPRNFINQQKIEQAKILLLEEMSITDVAMYLGFTTSSYFSTVFKKFTLYTPSEYIKNSLGEV